MAAKIGVLAASGMQHIEAIRDGLREQQLIEGIDVDLMCRAAGGDLAKLPSLVSDILTAAPEIIVAVGAVTAQAVRQASRELPMVYAMVIDPVAEGLAGRSGEPLRNSTGVTTFDPDQATTHAKLLLQLLPKLSRVAVLADKGVPTYLADANRSAFRCSGVEVRTVKIAGPKPDLAQAFATITQSRADALIVLEHPTNGFCCGSIAKLAMNHAIPTLFAQDHESEDGFISYGTSLRTAVRRAPRLLKKMLAGALPADIPIDRFSCPELVVNQKTAVSLGITIPGRLRDGLFGRRSAYGPSRHIAL